MGRLRGTEDAEFVKDITKEVHELFGLEDAVLHVLDRARAIPAADPLYGEPPSGSRDLFYIAFPIKLVFEEPVTEDVASEFGDDITQSFTVYMSVKILEEAGIERHSNEERPHDKDHVSVGDVVETFRGVEVNFYDVINVGRTGFVNDTEKFSLYRVEMRRREKYFPERKVEEQFR